MSNKIHELITMKLADSISDLSQTKWNKLMFFIDATGACLNNKTYTGFNYIKLPYGPVPQDYRSIIFDMVENEIVIEVKSVDALHPVHQAQLLSYLKLADKRLGFLININVTLVKEGFKRMVNNY